MSKSVRQLYVLAFMNIAIASKEQSVCLHVRVAGQKRGSGGIQEMM